MTLESQNPYSTPQAETILHPSAQVDPRNYYVDGKFLVVRHGAELPDRCIKTGVELPDAKRKKKTIYWAHPAWALLILAGLLVYFIVYLCIRKKVTLTFSLSKSAKNKKLVRMLACLGGAFGSLALAIFFFANSDSSDNYAMFGVFGMILFVVGLIAMSFTSHLYRIKKHQDGWYYLVGFSQQFLDAIQAEHPLAETSQR
ncbi:MAG: hypothetical protein AB8F34_13845 [Akkermansiaceae bacterium]